MSYGPPDGAYHRTLAPVLSSAVLVVGSRMDLDEAAARLGPVTDGRTISRIPQLLVGDAHWEAIAGTVNRPAEYLDNHDVPLEYHRCRRLDYSDLLPPRSGSTCAAAQASRRAKDAVTRLHAACCSRGSAGFPSRPYPISRLPPKLTSAPKQPTCRYAHTRTHSGTGRGGP